MTFLCGCSRGGVGIGRSSSEDVVNASEGDVEVLSNALGGVGKVECVTLADLAVDGEGKVTGMVHVRLLRTPFSE